MDRLTDVFRDVFDDETLVISEETAAKDIEDWDSLTHITLIQAIEDEFNVKFAMKEVVNLENVGGIVAIVESRGT